MSNFVLSSNLIKSKIHKLDLKFMREILDFVHGGISDKKLHKCANFAIEKNSENYYYIYYKVLGFYTKYGLVYNADENPFIG